MSAVPVAFLIKPGVKNIIFTQVSFIIIYAACGPKTAGGELYDYRPAGRRKKLKLLDINSEEELKEPSSGMSDDNGLLPAEKGVAFCDRLFHDTVDGANASAIVMSLIETAKANNLNIYQYLYTLLLYMPDYKNEPADPKQLMPWSEFIKENCSGITDTEKILPENRGDLPI